MLDLIGDIHGYAERLEALLRKLGYHKRGSAWRHAERQAVFLGDYVDRGPQQLHTVNIVRAMVDDGSAQAIMGNHEYNAVGFATLDAERPGDYLRPRSEKNSHQHQAFIREVTLESRQHKELIAWFKTLPVYLDTGEIRAVHACWHQGYLDALAPYLNADHSIKDSAWPILHDSDSLAHRAVETVLKGTEVQLPDGVFYTDKDGVQRDTTRTRWWDRAAQTYAGAAIVDEQLRSLLPQLPLPQTLLYNYDELRPVFIGHYWASGTPRIHTPHIAVLDYSIGKGTPDGKLCAYRWSGEATLSNDHFVWVDGPPDVHR
ncbi:metallophosphoesterase [Pseudomonas baltica]|uniref:metallophosphoesterase n=1 Tax=Pseudomonas baltica TaxID=2762576 RepID=UPI00289C4E6F|nr:metallophosphoesterase [Pseudomonas baltica]